ncbi:MAG TPA: InlB B-repeat-containing protein [Candidatus Anaerofilum faecale]|nr:InlB B-repeat-containing protein [Candidatus Anaerofilum faecale]
MKANKKLLCATALATAMSLTILSGMAFAETPDMAGLSSSATTVESGTPAENSSEDVLFLAGSEYRWSFELKFDANGGENAPATLTAGNNDQYRDTNSFKIPNQLPTRDGYEFLGWAENEEGSGHLYQVGEYCQVKAVGDPGTGGFGSKTLYAVWEEMNPITVHVQDNVGGTASASVEFAAEGETVTLTATPQTGYHFKEWKASPSSVVITDNAFIMPGEPVTVTAVFEEHQFTGEWKSDGTNHWKECSCGAKGLEAAHTGGTATCTEKAACAICGQQYGELKAHTWNTESWQQDTANHWRTCTVCGAADEKAAHTYSEWVVTKEATATESGSRERSCTVCGHKVVESIPATGDTTPTDPENTPDQPAALPQTGDSFNVWLVVGLLVVCAGVLAAVLVVHLKKRKE